MAAAAAAAVVVVVGGWVGVSELKRKMPHIMTSISLF